MIYKIGPFYCIVHTGIEYLLATVTIAKNISHIAKYVNITNKSGDRKRKMSLLILFVHCIECRLTSVHTGNRVKSVGSLACLLVILEGVGIFVCYANFVQLG